MFTAVALIAVASVGLARPASAETAAPTFDRGAWKSDFERIKAGLANGYANFDWQVDQRGFNPARASQQLGAALDRTNSDLEATLLLVRLVDALDDPHVRLVYGLPPSSAKLLPLISSLEPLPTADCAPNGYAKGRSATTLTYVKAPGWKPIDNEAFPAGLIGETGSIRIPAFGEDRYLHVCNGAAKPGMSDKERQLATRGALNRYLDHLVSQLRAKGMKRLVIDVTGNAGGTEWSSEVAAKLASGTLKRRAPRLAGPACDRSALWQGGERPCSIYAKPEETEELEGTGRWTGPLAVLTDPRSASATEEFVTWLKDNNRAVIAGGRTAGAGCNYVDGGHAIALRAAPLHLMIPNCSRYTGEGINEIEGIALHLPVEWATVKPGDFPAQLNRIFAVRLPG